MAGVRSVVSCDWGASATGSGNAAYNSWVTDLCVVDVGPDRVWWPNECVTESVILWFGDVVTSVYDLDPLWAVLILEYPSFPSHTVGPGVVAGVLSGASADGHVHGLSLTISPTVGQELGSEGGIWGSLLLGVWVLSPS